MRLRFRAFVQGQMGLQFCGGADPAALPRSDWYQQATCCCGTAPPKEIFMNTFNTSPIKDHIQSHRLNT